MAPFSDRLRRLLEHNLFFLSNMNEPFILRLYFSVSTFFILPFILYGDVFD
jgi:hypothetical protein